MSSIALGNEEYGLRDTSLSALWIAPPRGSANQRVATGHPSCQTLSDNAIRSGHCAMAK